MLRYNLTVILLSIHQLNSPFFVLLYLRSTVGDICYVSYHMTSVFVRDIKRRYKWHDCRCLVDNCRCLGDDCRCPWQCADTWYMSYYVMLRHREYQKTKTITFIIIPIKHSIIL